MGPMVAETATDAAHDDSIRRKGDSAVGMSEDGDEIMMVMKKKWSYPTCRVVAPFFAVTTSSFASG